MCDYPTCEQPSVFTHICGDRVLHLCSTHESLFRFINKVDGFTIDWGF
jgi:hypothetical protein